LGRHYTAGFVQLLRKASGSRAELEPQLNLAGDLGCLPEAELREMPGASGRVGMMLLSLEGSLLRRSGSTEAPHGALETTAG